MKSTKDEIVDNSHDWPLAEKMTLKVLAETFDYDTSNFIFSFKKNLNEESKTKVNPKDWFHDYILNSKILQFIY